eukprot:GHVT01088142.1.p1 GENE.GHVT01088142.1~~GHVT01088142.1.p1  ORF type:complete len:258 (+),score=31.75 GHVT01088142.1:416-1189(+)
MAARSQHHERLLQQLRHYADVGRLRRDVEQLLHQIDTLRPNVGTFARGTQQLVLYYLYGTLAIVYRGCTYHLPVTIYFDPPYPACAPRCFLTPTGDMAIKPRHKHASETGRIYLPYLANWNPMDAKLGHLLALMASTFSEDPPLFSIRASSQSGLVPSSVRPSSSYGPSIHPPSPASSSSTSTNVAPHPSAIASSSAFPSISPPLSRREQLQRDVENLIKERWTPIVLPLARRTQRLNEIKVNDLLLEQMGMAHVHS